MPVITIVGAGPVLGSALARTWGHNGYQVALVSRSQSKVDAVAKTLREEGIDATGFAGDVLDAESLAAAFAAVRATYGHIDVLEYSPADPTVSMVGPVEVTPEDIQPQLDFYLYGAIRATSHVLPEMLATGAGTLLFTTGGGSINPLPMMGNINAAAAALRNWALNLHLATADRGVFAGHVAISAWIGSGAPEAEPDSIARAIWEFAAARHAAELHHVAPMPTG